MRVIAQIPALIDWPGCDFQTYFVRGWSRCSEKQSLSAAVKVEGGVEAGWRGGGGGGVGGRLS